MTTPGPCSDCRTGCPVIGGPCSPTEQDPLERVLLDALTRPVDPADRATGCFPGPRVIPLDDAEPDALYPSPRLPAPLGPGERLVALALVGPWLAAATGWALVVGAHRVVRAVLR